VIAWLVGRLESGKMVVERASSCTSSNRRIPCMWVLKVESRKYGVERFINFVIMPLVSPFGGRMKEGGYFLSKK
jgi:hypothetical protein